MTQYVDEDQWVLKCPRCGNTDPNVQCPITLATPSQCAACPDNPWKDKGDYHKVIHYVCMQCHTTYLIPKLEAEDREYRMFGHDG
jgi:hypothetical protein